MIAAAPGSGLRLRSRGAFAGTSVGERLAVCLVLAKPRIVALVLFTAVVAAAVAAGGRPAWGALLVLIVSGALTAGGAAALNQYVDRDLDRRMERTRHRPLAAGVIQHPGGVLAGGSLAIGLGLALAALASPLLALFELAGAATYVVIYSVWLKRRTMLAVVVGGAAGSAAVLGGWAVVDPTLGVVPWLLAGLVFLWTPPHFWSLAIARQADYGRAGLPMLPLVVGPRSAAWWVLAHAAATVAVSLWLGIAGELGAVYFSGAAAGGGGFLATSVELVRRPEAAVGWRVFKWSGPYLGIVFLALLLETVAGAAAS